MEIRNENFIVHRFGDIHAHTNHFRSNQKVPLEMCTIVLSKQHLSSTQFSSQYNEIEIQKKNDRSQSKIQSEFTETQ